MDGTMEYSALVMWVPSRGLLMERVRDRYRFVGGTNEPTEGSPPEPEPECDTRPAERELRGRAGSEWDSCREGNRIGAPIWAIPDTPLRSKILERLGEVGEDAQDMPSDPEGEDD